MNQLHNIPDAAQAPSERVLAQIDGLPDQLLQGWEQGCRELLPVWSNLRQVILCSVGGSAMAGDLLQAYAALQGPGTVCLWRDYGLPAWANGPETLVLIVSHSGEDEEALASLRQALERGLRCLVIAAGGEVAQQANQAGLPCWTYPDQGMPYEALGWLFGLAAAALFRLGLLPDVGTEIAAAVDAMKHQQSVIQAAVPASGNPARRMAGQMMGRWVTVAGAGLLAPVARHWQNQIARLAKTWVQAASLPEMDHTLLGAVLQPDSMLSSTMIVFLRGAIDSPRNLLRTNLTKQVYMLEGLGTDFVDVAGETPLAQQWTGLHFGEYAAYYLALAYGSDPAPSQVIEEFKREMAAARQ